MRKRGAWVSCVLLLVASGCSSLRRGDVDHRLEGMASWYGQEYAGRTTANGEIFDPMSLTAAHRSLPFGTVVRVRNQANGKIVQVRINDRGPFIENRIIDLSYAAAVEIGMVNAGVAPVRVEVVRIGAGEREPPAPTVVTIPQGGTRTAPVVVEPAPPVVDFPLPAETVAEPVIIEDEVVLTEEIFEPAPVVPPRPAITPAPKSPAPSQGRFAVQVGAFSLEANASSLAAELRSKGERVYVERDGNLYKVRIGRFESRIDAIEARERLDATGYSTLMLTLD